MVPPPWCHGISKLGHRSAPLPPYALRPEFRPSVNAPMPNTHRPVISALSSVVTGGSRERYRDSGSKKEKKIGVGRDKQKPKAPT
ncbi:Hypothetical protein NTJ_11165 [Nesidiocoris tenuis]|uniref:Uncharacterized protein n=1 Tax=Nesidiocoris tenuis TaxID=355587 RepID=A0ABN7B1R0_9HEMI|nr:Hypothetical protein NTJ_11165 [Nesidiocoris tenuis]